MEDQKKFTRGIEGWHKNPQISFFHKFSVKTFMKRNNLLLF